ncbi:MAG TPA: ABC transporter permease subunit, partial [Candidatus Hydrogenedentes bacterium]|nr:ABC transporter permease subunit [Candidatus Hydrogenedentota bacterium]
LLLGTPLAWWLARTASWARVPVRAVVALPLVLPPSVLGFYLLVTLGPSGPGGQLTQALGLGLLPFTFAGLVVGSLLYSLPFVIFVVILTVYFGRNIVLLFMAIGAVEWLTMARIVRAQVLSLRQREFIEATTVLGLPRYRVLLWHLIPNTLGPIIVYATLTVPRVMLMEAFLSYLGLGVQAPMSSWGLLINEGVQTMENRPWMVIFPSLALSLTLFSLNFLGDGLRDALDVRASKD